jgi:hypothetical protein
LAAVTGRIKPRYRAGIEAMLRNGEVEQAIWPLLTAAVWKSAGALEAPTERAHILSAFGWETSADLEHRKKAAIDLLTTLTARIGLASR